MADPVHPGAVPSSHLLRNAAVPPTAGGAPLRREIRTREEGRLGIDLAAVRVHHGPRAARLADELGARAFVFGGHVFASALVADLEAPSARDILSHELDHVAQARRDGALVTTVLRLTETQVDARLRRRAAAVDKPGYLAVLRGENGAHALSAVVRARISTDLASGFLTLGDAWRAVALQLLGTESGWSATVRNFVDGLERGTFVAPAGMPPANVDGLTQLAVETAHTTAEGNTGFEHYRAAFDSRWEINPYRLLSTTFDVSLSSKGPRTRRARAIFDDLYANDINILLGYDIDAVFRAQVDLYIGPDATNLAASPRIQDLRAVFAGLAAPITTANAADPAFVAFKAQVIAAAQVLTSDDREAVARSQQWRQIIDRAVTNLSLQVSLSETIQSAWQSAPPPPPPAGSGPGPGGGPGSGGGPAPAGPTGPLLLTAQQRVFASNLSLAGPGSPMTSRQARETLTFTPSSTRNPAGLPIRSKVALSPPGQVSGSAESEQPWPAASATGTPHAPIVRVDGGSVGHTDFTATLTLVHASRPVTHTPATAALRLVDGRQAWFAANVKHGLIFSDQNTRFLWSPGNTIEYYGGQQALSVVPRLPSANPGVRVWVRAQIRKNGAVLQSFPAVEFGETADSRHLGGVVVLESSPPPTAPDNMSLSVEFLKSSAPAAAPFHTLTQAFSIRPGTAFNNAAVLAGLRADHAALNATTAGSVLATMLAAGGQQARVAQSVQAGIIQLEPFLIRADSASFIRSHPALGSPANRVAYAMGHTAVDDAHTLVAVAGADAWRWSSFPQAIFINLTPSLRNPATKRPVNAIVPFLVHESVHVTDVRPNATTPIERYKTEFRAYWMDGQRDHLSTAFDPSMTARGPKSPKARAIFEHLYGSPTYEFVKPAYDANTGGFRDQVNAYIVPDGINLIVSPRLERLRTRIAAYSGANFPAHRGLVQAAYNATNPDDKQQIEGARAWRYLVDRTYSNSTERANIKTLLRIPS